VSAIKQASDLIDQYAHPEEAIAVTRLVGQRKAYWQERPDDETIVDLLDLNHDPIVTVFLEDEDFSWNANPKEIA
jgi:hypothetical protein